MRSTRRSGILLLAMLGCSRGEAGIPVVQEWEVSSEPVVAIGVAEGDAAYELHRASDAIAMRDGRIIVANSGTSELRVFDSTGAYLESIGRQGGGPGEFRGAITLYSGPGDSLIAFDNGNARLSLFTPDGEYVRLLDVDARPFPWDDWLHGGAWVSGVRDVSVRPCVAAALLAVPVPDVTSPPVRRAILDEAGRLWLRPLGSAEAPSWRVYSLDGTPLGEVRLPPGLRPYHIGADFVLGSRTGGDESERIELYRVAAPGTAESSGCRRPALANDSVVPPDLGADLRNAVVAQEMYYADHRGYAENSDSLRWTASSGAALTIVAASDGGWAGILSLPDDGPMCAIAIGDVTPAGWPEGSPQCAPAPLP